MHPSPLTPTPGEGPAARPFRRQAERPLILPAGLVRARSAAMVELYRRLAAVAPSEMPVLLLGETGVGKEGLARAVHMSSAVRGRAFEAINCAAIPQELLEAELFGIGRGVATGVLPRAGRFQRADGGTLFLDEIGDLPVVLQVKLLRVLQEQRLEPVGAPPQPWRARIVAATHGDLARRMAAGLFRHDLYYRLAGCVATVPPLRERREDIRQLAVHFLRRGGGEARLDAAAEDALAGHDWPGNVRQLEHTVRLLALECPVGRAISSQQVEATLRAQVAALSLVAMERPNAQAACASASFAPDLKLENLERRAVREALSRTGWNRTRAARLLGISRESLRRRLHKLVIEPPHEGRAGGPERG